MLTLIHAIAAGADSIDDTDVLRAGGTEALPGHEAMAPSTLGTFLRAFSFGHVRRLDRVPAWAIGRAWAAGASPGEGRLTIDIDSFLGEAWNRPRSVRRSHLRSSPCPTTAPAGPRAGSRRPPPATALTLMVNRWIEAK